MSEKWEERKCVWTIWRKERMNKLDSNQIDIFLFDVVIKQNANGHHGSCTGRDRSVHEDDSIVSNVFRKTQVIQLWKNKTI